MNRSVNILTLASSLECPGEDGLPVAALLRQNPPGRLPDQGEDRPGLPRICRVNDNCVLGDPHTATDADRS